MKRMRQNRCDELNLLFSVATVTDVAKTLGIKKPAVSVWDEVPPKHVPALCEAYGFRPEQLRPDIYRKITYPKKRHSGENPL